MPTLTYGQLSDIFKKLYPNGRFDGWASLGKNKILFIGLKKDADCDKLDTTVDFTDFISGEE